MNTKPQSELEWLLYHLWLKTGPAPPQFIFTLADTVFYRASTAQIPEEISIPECWYFTSKDGYILKKNRYNVSTKEIQKTFTKKMDVHDQIAAIAYYEDKEDGRNDVIVQHLPVTDFRAILFYSPAVNDALALPSQQFIALQKFIPSKQIKNTVYRVKWKHNSLTLIDLLQNVNSMFDTKVSIDDRTPCFETSGLQGQLLAPKELLSVPQQIEDNLNRCMKQIRDHLLTNSKLDLTCGTFYFKVDRRTDNLILIFCTNLEISNPSQSSSGVCLGQQVEVNIKAWRKKLVIQMSSMDRDEAKSLPEIISRKNSQRPQSNYSSAQQLSRISQKIIGCPFCCQVIKEDLSNTFEVTLNQVLKLHNFFIKNKLSQQSQLDERVTQSKLYESLIKNNENLKIPACLARMFPKMSYEKLEKKRLDPNFLYENAKMCEECYETYKIILPSLRFKKNGSSRRSHRASIGNEEVLLKSSGNVRNIPIPNLPKSQAIAQTKLYQVTSKPYNKVIAPSDSDVSLIKKRSLNYDEPCDNADMRDILYSLNRNSTSAAGEPLTRQQPDLNLNQQSSFSVNGRPRSGIDLCNEIIRTFDKQQQQSFDQVSQGSKDEKQPPPAQTMTMMFQKVEAGKQVAESLVKIKKDHKTDAIEVLEKQNRAASQNEELDFKSQERIEQQVMLQKRITYQEGLEKINESKSKRLQSAHQRLQKAQIMPTQSDTNQQDLQPFLARKITRIQSSKERANVYMHQNQSNLLAHKINRAKEQKEQVLKRAYSKGPQQRGGIVDWEMEYSQAIKAKTREVANEIFDTCDRLEKGESLNIPLSTIQDQYQVQYQSMKMTQSHPTNLILPIDNQTAQVAHARMFDNFTPSLVLPNEQDDIDMNQQEQIKNLRKRRGQPNNVRQNYHQNQQVLQDNAVLMGQTSAERIASQSPIERKKLEKQRLMTAYGLAFPKINSSGSRPNPLTVGRIRPQSSKPPGYNTANTPSTASHQIATSKPVGILQAYADVFPSSDLQRHQKTRHSQNSIKHQQRLPHKEPLNIAINKQPQNTVAAGAIGGGLFDMNNMTKDHVKEIASKADELIEIIKNIKASVGTEGENNQGAHQCHQTRKEIDHEGQMVNQIGGINLCYQSEIGGGGGDLENQNRDPNSWW